ncbi:MAG: VIT1/CCC1 transporter family protein [Nitrospirales bacterium]
MATSLRDDHALAQELILDELFDLKLYATLRDLTQGPLQKMLDELIQVETKHLAFWRSFFSQDCSTLNLARRIKLHMLVFVCRLFGTTAIHLVVEAIEVHGVRKYLSLWEAHGQDPLGSALRDILNDEMRHEDQFVTALTERKINPERIRNIFFGMNDGLVEILGAVSGFFAAFSDSVMVLIAGTTTAVAGALSMTAGAYVATSSEREVKRTEYDKQRFLDQPVQSLESMDHPFGSALLVGGSYLIGALVPLLPVFVGATSALASLVTAGTMIILVSMILAFLSGMAIKQRILINLVIIAAAVSVTYAIGLLARTLWGVSI